MLTVCVEFFLMPVASPLRVYPEAMVLPDNHPRIDVFLNQKYSHHIFEKHSTPPSNKNSSRITVNTLWDKALQQLNKSKNVKL